MDVFEDPREPTTVRAYALRALLLRGLPDEGRDRLEQAIRSGEPSLTVAALLNLSRTQESDLALVSQYSVERQAELADILADSTELDEINDDRFLATRARFILGRTGQKDIIPRLNEIAATANDDSTRQLAEEALNEIRVRLSGAGSAPDSSTKR